MIQGIFFRPQRGYKRYNISDSGVKTVKDTLYQLDGVISEQHTSTARVTKHPVEYGVDLSSHVIKQPMRVVVNGIVTNSPGIKQLWNRLPGGADLVSQSLQAFTNDRVRQAYKGLIDLQNERQPLRLQTGLLVYDNMVLTHVSAPNDLQNNLKVQLTFEEVFIADGTTTGALQAVTTTPTSADYLTASETLTGLGIIGLRGLGLPTF